MGELINAFVTIIMTLLYIPITKSRIDAYFFCNEARSIAILIQRVLCQLYLRIQFEFLTLPNTIYCTCHYKQCVLPGKNDSDSCIAPPSLLFASVVSSLTNVKHIQRGRRAWQHCDVAAAGETGNLAHPMLQGCRSYQRYCSYSILCH